MREEVPHERNDAGSPVEDTDDSVADAFQAQGVVRPRNRLEKGVSDIGYDQFTPPPLGVKAGRTAEFKPAKSKEETFEATEGVAATSPSTPSLGGRKREKKKGLNKTSTTSIFRFLFRAGFRRQLGLVPAVLLLVIGVCLSGYLGRQQGEAVVRAELEARPAVVIRPFPPAVVEKLRNAMTNLRAGNFAEGERGLVAMEGSPEAFPSLTYLAALAALQKGEVELADQRAEASIAKNERVSDALALRAVAATQLGRDPSRLKMTDPVVQSEQYLRQAIAADPSNPYPHFELANSLRFQRKKDEALAEMQLARALLNPMDSHLVMEITVAFLTMEDAEISALPAMKPGSDNPRQLFPEAYAEMRRGNFENAAALLKASEKSLSPEVFDYLVNDPALRKFSSQPALVPFYQN